MVKKKKINKKAFVPITINKSNLIINAIGHPSATAQKVFNMALRYIDIDRQYSPAELSYFKDIEKKSGVDFSSGIVSSFSQSEFLRLIPGRNNAWPETRDYLFRRDGGLAQEYIVSIPDSTGSYSTGFNALITGAYYDNDTHKIYIKFQDSEVMRKELTTLSNYTMLTLNIESQFKSAYTIRIYEIIDSYISKENWKSKQNHKTSGNVHNYQIGVERLKWMIGAVYVKDKVDDDDMKKNLKKMQAIINNRVDLCKTDEDYDRILKDYGDWLSDTRWAHFQTILDRVIKELNSKEDLILKHYSYEPIKVGRRYKFLNFIVEDVCDDAETDVKDEVISDEEKDKAILAIRDILSTNMLYSNAITDSQCYTLAKTVEYDYERFKGVYKAFIDYAKRQASGITSPMGLLIKMIKENAEPNTSVSYASMLDNETSDIEKRVEQCKKMIRDNGYMPSKLNDDSVKFIEKSKRYICVSFGISPSKSKEINIDTLCRMVKKTDELAMTICEENGQISMAFEE